MEDPAAADAVVDDAIAEEDGAAEVDVEGRLEKGSTTVLVGAEAVVEEEAGAGAVDVVASTVAGSTAPRSTEPDTRMTAPARLNHDRTGASFRHGPDTSRVRSGSTP